LNFGNHKALEGWHNKSGPYKVVRAAVFIALLVMVELYID